MAQQRGTTGALALGFLGVVALGASSAAVWLGVKERQLTAAHQRLYAQCEALRVDAEQKDRALVELSDRRKSAEVEIARLTQEAAGHTAMITRLREQVGGLEQQATTLQTEIARAQAEGHTKETTVADLTKRLEDTRAQADAAASALKAMGYTKDELTDQVGKLQARLTESDRSLADLRRRTEEQERAITKLNDDLFARSAALTSLQKEANTLRVSKVALEQELASRPKPSPFNPVEIYAPSRDRK